MNFPEIKDEKQQFKYEEFGSGSGSTNLVRRCHVRTSMLMAVRLWFVCYLLTCFLWRFSIYFYTFVRVW